MRWQKSDILCDASAHLTKTTQPIITSASAIGSVKWSLTYCLPVRAMMKHCWPVLRDQRLLHAHLAQAAQEVHCPDGGDDERVHHGRAAGNGAGAPRDWRRHAGRRQAELQRHGIRDQRLPQRVLYQAVLLQHCTCAAESVGMWMCS